MNILCVIDNLGPGGAQRQIVELAKGFKSEGHSVTLLTYYLEPFFNRELLEQGILIDYIPARNRIKLIFEIRTYIREKHFDAVLSFLPGPNFICECAGLPLKQWRLVIGERNADPQILRSPKSVAFRWFHFFADAIVSNSKRNLKYVYIANPLLKRSKCRVIHNIVDFNHWQIKNNQTSKLTPRLKLVVASSHIYRKNANGLLDALNLMTKKEREKISVEWFGDRLNPPYYDSSYPEALKKIQKYGLEPIVKFFPATNELCSRIQEADAVGLFSFNEGLPNTVCEAMSCGKPVICSAVSDIPDWLSYDQNLLFDPADPVSIKNSLLHLIYSDGSYLKELGRVNREIALKNFQGDSIIKEYLKILSQ